MTIALLTAAGVGSRMHLDTPKQFLHINDKPLVVYTMEAFQKHPNIDGIIVVTLEGWTDVIWAFAKEYGINKLKWVVPGGATGQDSIRNGLEKLNKELPNEDVTVMVHDGNRPMVSAEIISDSLATYAKCGSAVAVVPCTEVVFESDDGVSSCKSTEREKLFRTQTPHTYKLTDLLSAHKEAEKRNLHGMAASCMLMKELGHMTYFSKGSEKNLKITTVDDLDIFKALLRMKNERD